MCVYIYIYMCVCVCVCVCESVYIHEYEKKAMHSEDDSIYSLNYLPMLKVLVF